MSARPSRHQRIQPKPESIAWPIAGVCATTTFLVLFFMSYFQGVPALDHFVLMVLGAAGIGAIGYQMGTILSSAPAPPKPLSQAKQAAIASLLDKPDARLDNLLDDSLDVPLDLPTDEELALAMSQDPTHKGN